MRQGESMKRRIVVVGGGGHARSVMAVLRKLKDWQVDGYVDREDRGDVLGCSWLGDDDVLPKLYADGCRSAVMGLGQIDLLSSRCALSGKVAALGFVFPAIVSPLAIVNDGVTLGNGVVIFDGAIVNVGSAVGEFAIINTGAVVDHDCIIGRFVHIAPGSVLSGGVRVGDNSLLGTGSRVIQNISIGSGCLIGAGAVVVKDCEGSGIYTGIPARKRDNP